ncbi:kelch repeat-containing protein [Mucilaginibacter sp. BT774]|uniref:Kelch repeat-containing protein n=1 Tax=Mucilaginibacter sp. BT774 TaxID=3062276 RepID=UPI0026767D08|nr:kelch repeat-containing protein [Mucilaginibacter sp. BT774]MDO3628190.1 kelch repeat-containing protein [Mucilaginibacter sp. BT774]
MLKFNKAFLFYLYKTVFLLLFTFQFLDGTAQGLLFNSNDSLLNKRTSLHVFSNDVPVFHDHLYIQFDLSLWDNAHLGYVCNLAEKDNSYSLSYLYMNGSGFLNFNIDRKSNKIQIPLDKSILKKGKWMKVRMDFDLKNDKVDIDINNKLYQASELGFKDQAEGNLIFGKNQFYTEVPNMAIKNLSVGDHNSTYVFPLDEWKGTEAHDQEGNVIGAVENPVWLINESYFWKPVYTNSFKQVAGLNFNTIDQNLFIFKKDSIITFNSESKRAIATPYQNPFPVPMVLGKSIFNARQNKCYIYELFDIPKGMPSVASLNMDKNSLKWEAIGKTILPQQRHHHNMFYNLQQDSIYLFGGYGAYKYYNKFLKYDAGKDSWIEVPFKGDNITPRFFAAAGSSDNPDEILLFGGYGNDSGNQIVGGKQFYDLYRINLKTHIIKKAWSIHPQNKEVFVPANNLILSPDKKYFYALCYPHEIAKTEIRLYKFSLQDGSYEVVSAPIPVTSERIESDINLFFSHKTNEFFCTIQEFTDRVNSSIRIFSLLAPPVSNAAYLKALAPPQSKGHLSLYLAIGVVLIIGVFVVIIIRRKPEGTLPEPEVLPVPSPLPAEKKETGKKQNAIYLLGEFAVYNKNGRDITYLFSPKIKQLFILILINSRDYTGITSKKISALLWPDKDVAKTKNIKGVTFNHLRSIISDLNGIELTFQNDNYLFKFSEELFCDYFIVSELIKESHWANNDYKILEHFDLVSRGTLLSGMPDQWLDDFKKNYDEQLVGMIQPLLIKYYESGDMRLVPDLAKLILDTDPFNDTALKYQLKAIRKQKGIEQARKVYDQFIAEYKRSFGSDYQTSFEKLIQ